jgi:hypothetical protein
LLLPPPHLFTKLYLISYQLPVISYQLSDVSFQFTDGSLGYWLKNVHGVTLAAQAFTDY